MNMRKISAMPILIVIFMLLIVISACTRKDNPAGDNWSDITPLAAIDSTFNLGYSYTHDNSVYGTETSLVCGEEDEVEAVSIMRFTGLPDTTFTFLESPVLKLVATRRSPLDRSPLVLSFHKLNANWAPDSTDMISDDDITTLMMPDFAVQDSISTSGDTLQIDIPDAIIENWETDDVTGFNLVIKTMDEGWLEFRSAESGNGPLLTFKYQKTGSTDTLSYSQRPSPDSYRITGEQATVTENVWKVKNLLPQRLFVHNSLSNSIFKDKDGNQLDSLDMRRMTINKAELVLFVKDNPYYSDKLCYFYPYRVRTDTLAGAVALTTDDLENITHTYSSPMVIGSDSVKIDITAITQGFTSGDLENYGMVIKNTAEMINFGNLEFWHYSNAPVGKKPYVRIYYTVPYLKGY